MTENRQVHQNKIDDYACLCGSNLCNQKTCHLQEYSYVDSIYKFLGYDRNGDKLVGNEKMTLSDIGKIIFVFSVTLFIIVMIIDVFWFIPMTRRIDARTTDERTKVVNQKQFLSQDQRRTQSSQTKTQSLSNIQNFDNHQIRIDRRQNHSYPLS